MLACELYVHVHVDRNLIRERNIAFNLATQRSEGWSAVLVFHKEFLAAAAAIIQCLQLSATCPKPASSRSNQARI
jgi:hypothetical protein